MTNREYRNEISARYKVEIGLAHEPPIMQLSWLDKNYMVRRAAEDPFEREWSKVAPAGDDMWMELRLLWAIDQLLERMQQLKLPLPPRWSLQPELSPVAAIGGYFARLQQVIVVNPRGVNSHHELARTFSESEQMTIHPMVDVIAHEAGHYLHSVQCGACVHPRHECGECKGLVDEIQKLSNVPVNQNARDSIVEFVAEVFRLHLQGVRLPPAVLEAYRNANGYPLPEVQ